MTKMNFRQVDPKDLLIIKNWLDEPHVQEFWDNSQEHKDDIAIFANGRKQSSLYYDGIFTYWLALMDLIPYALIMTSKIEKTDDVNESWLPFIPEKTEACSLDFMIGNTDFLGKGYGSSTLQAFTHMLFEKSQKKIHTFIIDPNVNNPRAAHVYEKAGFKKQGIFQRRDENFELMVLKLS
jgi:RimJ/RimL family protein N-acetyltransferase